MSDDSGGFCCKQKKDVFNVRLFRIVQAMLKVTAVACDALMTVNFGVLVYGGEGIWVSEYIAGYSACGFIILLVVSYLLNFCWRYRACLVHNFLAYSVMVASRNIEFGKTLFPIEIVIFTSGIILTSIVLFYEYKNREKSKRIRKMRR